MAFNKSTTKALYTASLSEERLAVYDLIHRNTQTDGVYLDFKKVFDTVADSELLY